jgi:hypothetical protein
VIFHSDFHCDFSQCHLQSAAITLLPLTTAPPTSRKVCGPKVVSEVIAKALVFTGTHALAGCTLHDLIQVAAISFSRP